MAKISRLEPKVITNGATYQPVFAGTTEDNEKIVVYKNIFDDTYHLQRDNGEVWAIPPGSTIEDEYNADREIYYIKIVSPLWSGIASGSRWDLMAVQAR